MKKNSLVLLSCILLISSFLYYKKCSFKIFTTKSDYGDIFVVNDSKNGLVSKTISETYSSNKKPNVFINGLKKYYDGEIKKDKKKPSLISAGGVSIDLTGNRPAKVYFIRDSSTPLHKRNYEEIFKYTIFKLINMTEDQKLEVNAYINKAFDYIEDSNVEDNTIYEHSIKVLNNKTITIVSGKSQLKGESGVYVEVK